MLDVERGYEMGLTPRSREQAAGGCAQAHTSRALGNARGLDSGASCFPPQLSWGRVGWVGHRS